MKHFSLKSAYGHYMSKRLKEHSAVVVKFWLSKTLNFFENVH